MNTYHWELLNTESGTPLLLSWEWNAKEVAGGFAFAAGGAELQQYVKMHLHASTGIPCKFSILWDSCYICFHAHDNPRNLFSITDGFPQNPRYHRIVGFLQDLWNFHHAHPDAASCKFIRILHIVSATCLCCYIGNSTTDLTFAKCNTLTTMPLWCQGQRSDKKKSLDADSLLSMFECFANSNMCKSAHAHTSMCPHLHT